MELKYQNIVISNELMNLGIGHQGLLTLQNETASVHVSLN